MRVYIGREGVGEGEKRRNIEGGKEGERGERE